MARRARAQAQVPVVAVVQMRRPVVVHAADYASGVRVRLHAHREGQLIYGATGVMTVTTEDGTWVVPPQRAVFVPPGVSHAIAMRGQVAMRTAYFEPELLASMPPGCCVVQVSSLLRELLVRAAAYDKKRALSAAQERVHGVLLDEVRAARVAPLHLPLPADARLRRVTDALQENPGDGRTLEQFARKAGGSARTLARGFMKETGMSFGAWREQARLLRALELLAESEPVTNVALALGYAGPSAFIAMFRRALGATPSRYFRGR